MRRGAALALVAALLATGCQRALTLPGPGGIDGPQALASALVRHARAVTALRGEARVQVRAGPHGGSARQVVVAEAPDRLRLETLGVFGQPALVFAAAPGSQALFVARESRLYLGPGVARRLPMLPEGLEVADLVAVLMGRVPRPALAGAAEGRLEVLKRERRYRLETTAPATGERWRIVVDADGRYPVEVARLGAAGAPDMTVAFEDFRETAAGRFPHRIRVVDPGRPLDARIDYEAVELNPALPTGAFRIAAPRGAVTVEVE